MTAFRAVLACVVASWAAFLLAGCGRAPRVDRDAWRKVPTNCAVEYDTRGAIVASYCKVD